MVLFFAPIVFSIPAKIYNQFLPIQLGTPEFKVRHDNDLTPDVKRALLRFPDSQSCLQANADAEKQDDLSLMNWNKIVNDGDATVCAFRLLHDWGDVSKATTWLQAQGLSVGPTYSSAQPYIGADGTQRVTGTWSIKHDGPRFPASGKIRRIFSATGYGMGVNATYSPDGQSLLFVRFSRSTL